MYNHSSTLDNELLGAQVPSLSRGGASPNFGGGGFVPSHLGGGDGFSQNTQPIPQPTNLPSLP